MSQSMILNYVQWPLLTVVKLLRFRITAWIYKKLTFLFVL